MLAGLQLSTQQFAQLMNHDVRITGEPLFVLSSGYELYNPLLYLLCFFKYILNTAFQPYLSKSLSPIFTAIIASFILIVIFTIVREIIKKNDNIHGTARFANKADLKNNGMLKRGVVCGMLDSARVEADRKSDTSLQLHLQKRSRLISHTGKVNTLLLAPTGSGKGVSVLIPTLLSYKSSVIVFDPKRELWDITAGWRSTFSRTLLFSPLTSAHSVRFNPVMAISQGSFAFRDANLIANILMTPSSVQNQTDTEAYFSNAAKDLVTTSLLHIRFSDYPDKSLAGLLRYLTETDYKTLKTAKESEEAAVQGEAQFRGMIDSYHYFTFTDDETGKTVKQEARDVHRIIVDGAARQLNRNPKESSSVFSTAYAKLQLFEDPEIAATTSESDFEIEDFINSDVPISLYLSVPYSDIQRIAPVFRLLVSFMLKKFSEGETRHGCVKLKNHLLFILDEFPILGYFPDIAQTMGVLRGYGVSFLIVCQALSQLIALYGVNHPFLDHSVVQIIFAPGNVSDAEVFCKSIGQENVIEENTSRSGGRFAPMMGHINVSDRDMGRELLSASELKRLPGDKALILVHGMQPFIAEKVVYYEDPRFKKRLTLAAPETMDDLCRQLSGLPSQRKKGGFQMNKMSMPTERISTTDPDKDDPQLFISAEERSYIERAIEQTESPFDESFEEKSDGSEFAVLE